MRSPVRFNLGQMLSLNNKMSLNASDSNKSNLMTWINILVALPLFVYCLYLYSKWNEVPIHTDEIEVACLKYKQPASDSISDWTPVAEITYEINTSKKLPGLLRKGDIHVNFSNHWKPYKHYANSNISRDVFIRDSLALHSDFWRIAKLKKHIVEAKLNGTSYDNDLKELTKIVSSRYTKYDIDRINSQLKSAYQYQKTMLDSLSLLVKDDKTSWLNNPTKDLYALYYFHINCNWNITSHDDHTIDPDIQNLSDAKKITFCGYKGNNYYLNYFFLKSSEKPVSISDADMIQKVENPLNSPKWYSKFDISQSYFKVTLRCEAIDSVILKFNFVGATDFSEMTPKPDVIEMSSITFSDPYKIEQIKKNGLNFHAHFKEKDGLQTIRLFAITALMCVFTPTILMFLVSLVMLIISYIRNFRQYKRNKETTS